MNEMLHIFHATVYSILFLLATMTISLYAALLYRKVVGKCRIVLRTTPKSQLVAMVVFSAVATIHAQKTAFVDSSVGESGDGSKESPYKEISEVFDGRLSITSRVHIALAPGVYAPLVLSKEPLDEAGNPLSISIATYQREEEEDANAQWIIDGKGGDYAVYLPYSEAATNTIAGVTVKNAFMGISNFKVNNCVITDCDKAALVNCSVSKSEICNSGIGLDGGYAISCSFTACTNIVLKDAIAELCYVTNNDAIGILSGTIDTCLVEGNDIGATNAIILSSSILSNKKGGVLGDSLACNSLIAFNMDGHGRLRNFNIDTVTMTNCCTAPLPSRGLDNFYSVMPIYPDTYKLPLDSPIYRNGSTNFLIAPAINQVDSAA